MRRRRRQWALLAAVLLLLTGCWGRLEVNDLGMGTGLAIDVGKQQNVRVTLYLARGLAGAKGGEPTWAVTREAASIPDAVNLINRSSSRRVSLEHLRVILVGDEYARQGLDDLIDYIGRHAEVRLTTRFLVADGEAGTFLKTKPHLEALLPESIVKILEAKQGLNPRVKEFAVANIAASHSPWLYSIRERAGNQGMEMEIGGMAIFKRGRMVERLGLKESMVFSWVLNNPVDGHLVAPCAEEPEKLFSVRFEEGKAKIKPMVSGGKVSFQVSGTLKVILINAECSKSTMTIESQRALFKQQTSEAFLAHLKAATKQLQAAKADPAGFGKVLQRRYPAFFRQNAERWPELWSQAEVTYDVDVTIHHSRFLLEPINRTRQELQGSP